MDRSNFNPQVGDLVRIRSWDDMASEFGIDFEITGIDFGRYDGCPEGNASISIDMIEPVQEEEINGTEIDDFLGAMKVN